MPQYDSLSLAFSSSKPNTRSIFQNSTLKCTPLKHQSFLKCIKAFLPPLQPKTKCTKPLIFLDTTLPLIRSLFCGYSSFGSTKFFAFARLGSISCHDDELVFFFLHDDKGVRTLLLLLRPFFTRRPRLDWSFEANFSHLRSSQKFCRTKSEIIFFLKGQTVLLHFVIRSRLYVHSNRLLSHLISPLSLVFCLISGHRAHQKANWISCSFYKGLFSLLVCGLQKGLKMSFVVKKHTVTFPSHFPMGNYHLKMVNIKLGVSSF